VLTEAERAERQSETIEIDLRTPFLKLSKDMKAAARLLSQKEARWMVDQYYTMQDARIRANHQRLKMEECGEPSQLIDWVGNTQQRFESAVKSALGEFAARYATGQWLQSQHGIGPVLSAALLSNLDIRKAKTVGHFWRFCGLDPTCKWEKGQKRPWNAFLKSVVTFRLGETMVKFSGSDKCYYGRLWRLKKDALIRDNEAGKFAPFAAQELAEKCGNGKMKDTKRKECWEQGKLSPAHIHERARRWMVKLFLSHLHEVMYRDYWGGDPPAPFIFEHPELGDHRHKLDPPLYEGKTYDGEPLKALYGEADKQK